MNVFCLKHREYMTTVITKEDPKYTIVAKCKFCIVDDPNMGIRVILEPIRD